MSIGTEFPRMSVAQIKPLVPADGVKLGDGTTAAMFDQNGLIDTKSTGLKADIVAESTAGAGVTVDGLLIKDSQVGGLGATAPTTTVGGSVHTFEGTNNGVNKVLWKAPDTLAADRTVTGPSAGNLDLEVVRTKAALITEAAAGVTGKLDLFEDTANGTNKVTFQAAASIAADRTCTGPSGGNLLLEDSRLVNIGIRVPVLSLGAEAGEARLLTVQLADVNGVAVAEASDIQIEVLRATGIQALEAAFRLSDGGAGAVVTTTANARMIYTTDATGLAQVTITDVATGVVETLQIVVTSLSGIGLVRRIACAFAA